jgi:hypothetical protein
LELLKTYTLVLPWDIMIMVRDEDKNAAVLEVMRHCGQAGASRSRRRRRCPRGVFVFFGTLL